MHTGGSVYEDAKEISRWVELVRPATTTLLPSLLDTRDLFVEMATALPDFLGESSYDNIRFET